MYELPIAWEVTKASVSNVTQAMPLLDHLHDRHPALMSRSAILTADRGYDDASLIAACWDTYQIKPVIDIRNMWRDPDATRVLPGHPTVTYSYRGEVFCHDPVTGQAHTMSNGGFDKTRHALKKRCPARFAGISCTSQDACPVAQGIRISLKTDRRIFTPIDRASYQWAREYDRRTAVERVNSRLDVSFGLERHTIRGLQKMQLRLACPSPSCWRWPSGECADGNRSACGASSGSTRHRPDEIMENLLRPDGTLVRCRHAPASPIKGYQRGQLFPRFLIQTGCLHARNSRRSTTSQKAHPI